MQAAKLAVGTARKHPEAAFTVATYTARHWDEIAKALGVSRRTSQVVVRAGDPHVQREVRAAIGNLGSALTRARAIGVGNVAGDKRVTRELGSALTHTSNALHEVRAGRPHKVRRFGVVGLAVAGAGLTAWLARRGERS